ncbi:hypothetical protein DL93DRAFT_1732573 [Clavulina sp. PMI_390]|nr:hypothetical protein DL93DRAFT_1732573 [Clavulina sp. PMI_390]
MSLQAQNESKIMEGLSSDMELFIVLVNSTIPSDDNQLLLRGPLHRTMMEAPLDASITGIDRIHTNFHQIVQKGYSAIAAARKRLNATRSPVYALPPEILCDIFRKCIEDMEEVELVTTVLRLSHVSCTWRSNMLSLKDVFTQTADWDGWPAWLCRHWYEQSQERPITVRLAAPFLSKCSGPEGQQLMSTLRSLAHRIDKVTITGPMIGSSSDSPVLKIFFWMRLFRASPTWPWDCCRMVFAFPLI